MKRRLVFYVLLFFFCKEGLGAYTQVNPAIPALDETVFFYSDLHFLISILTGLILAFAFQILLTHLSIASGLSSIPSDPSEQNPDYMDTEHAWGASHRSSFGKSTYESERHEHESTQRRAESISIPPATHEIPTRGSATIGGSRHTHENTTRGNATVGVPPFTSGEKNTGATPFTETISESSMMGNTVFVSNPYKTTQFEASASKTTAAELGQAARALTAVSGIWTIVTATLALFFASWLAIELSVAASLTVGAVLGLAIWGLYYIFIVAFETSVFISLIGSLSLFASKSIQTLANTGTELLSKTENRDWIQTAEQITQSVREERQHEFYTGEIFQKIDQLLDRLPPHRIESIRYEAQTLFYDTALRPEVLLNRLRSLNRASFKNYLIQHRGIADEEAEKTLWQLESARDEVIQRVESMKEEIDCRLEQARLETLSAIAETRKTAASAAWWTFSAALSSGVAAVLGGLFAVVTGS